MGINQLIYFIIHHMKYLIILTSLFLFACNTTKTIVKQKEDTNAIKGYKKYNPQTGQYEWVSEDPAKVIDTIKTNTTPIDNTKNTKEAIVKGLNRAIKVAVILPFYADQNHDGEPIFTKSTWATNFYGGMKIALDSLVKKGISIDIRVFDDKASETELNKILLYEDVKNADLIIGPAGKSNLKIAANFAKTKGIPLVSPYNPADDITTNNPNYIQINPSLKSHCVAIVEDIYAHYKTPNITIISRNKPTETATYNYFINHINSIYSNIVPIHKLTIDEETNGISKTDFDICFSENRQNVIIIPSWSNEPFVAALLQRIEANRKGTPINVYGMPQWSSFDLLSHDLLTKLNTRITTSNPLDIPSPQTKEFKKLFFEKYHTIATDESIVGFDVTYLMIQMLKKYGKDFTNHLGEKNLMGFTSKYIFEKINDNPIESTNQKGIQRFENKSIQILKYQDGGFRLE